MVAVISAQDFNNRCYNSKQNINFRTYSRGVFPFHLITEQALDAHAPTPRHCIDLFDI